MKREVQYHHGSKPDKHASNDWYAEKEWGRRATTTYEVGAEVFVGLAYRMGGSYANDGSEGRYTVLSRIAGTSDYRLARAGNTTPGIPGYDWDIIVNASRLQLATDCLACGGSRRAVDARGEIECPICKIGEER